MAKKEKKAKKAGKGIFTEFKEFISKGNAFMLAVGVVIGGAFGAIVTAFVNILLSVATWAVPGGLKGLVTVLPPFPGSPGQVGPVGQEFTMDQLVKKTQAYAASQGVENLQVDDPTFVQWQNSLLAKYTQHGTKFTFNGAAVIDWGALLTAIISFLIIAIVLFIIVKVVATAAAKKAALEAKQKEAYYEKHPEERPVEPEPGAPEPTELDVLKEIRDALVKKEEAKQE